MVLDIPCTLSHLILQQFSEVDTIVGPFKSKFFLVSEQATFLTIWRTKKNKDVGIRLVGDYSCINTE